MAPNLNDNQLNVLRELTNGARITLDKYRMPWINGRAISPQTLRKLQKLRLVRLLDSSRKSFVNGNGYVISEKGSLILEQNSEVIARPATATKKQEALAMGLSFPPDITREELFSLIAEHKTNQGRDAENRTARWFITSVWRDSQRGNPTIPPDVLANWSASLTNDPQLWKSVLSYRRGLYMAHATPDEPLIEFGQGWDEKASRRTIAFEAVLNWIKQA